MRCRISGTFIRRRTSRPRRRSRRSWRRRRGWRMRRRVRKESLRYTLVEELETSDAVGRFELESTIYARRTNLRMRASKGRRVRAIYSCLEHTSSSSADEACRGECVDPTEQSLRGRGDVLCVGIDIRDSLARWVTWTNQWWYLGGCTERAVVWCRSTARRRGRLGIPSRVCRLAYSLFRHHHLFPSSIHSCRSRVCHELLALFPRNRLAHLGPPSDPLLAMCIPRRLDRLRHTHPRNDT